MLGIHYITFSVMSQDFKLLVHPRLSLLTWNTHLLPMMLVLGGLLMNSQVWYPISILYSLFMLTFHLSVFGESIASL